ncbi:hypothetical protein ACVXG7_10585 [Enterobacter hormaechei]
MKKVRFAKTQIVNILKLANSGMTVDDICYQAGSAMAYTKIENKNYGAM